MSFYLHSKVSLRFVVVFCWSVFIATGMLTSCVSPEKAQLPYNMARAALEAARDAEAPRLSPGFWFQAESRYREGERLYEDQEYEKARISFQEARRFAEKAENTARLKPQAAESD